MCTILMVSFLIALVLPLVNILFVYPAFTQTLISGIEEDARRLARNMLPPSLKHSELNRENLNQRFFGSIYRLENDFNLLKIKLFSSAGEVLYSTEPTEVGHLNTKPYFKDIVSKGDTFSILVTKDTKSMEGKTVAMDVVETYVPFMAGDKFLGAFEIYYDITRRKQELDNLVFYSTLVMILMSATLIGVVLILMRKEAARQKALAKAQSLKEEVNRITQHDLKSPIVSLLNGIEYLREFTPLDQEQASTLKDMREGAYDALTMINRSLDLYRMETGRYEFTPVETDVLALTNRIAASLSGPATITGVKVLTLVNGSVPAANATLPFSTEETLYYALVANIIKNAIEASGSGDRVTINLSDKDGLKLTVHNPAAVPEEIRETFFDKYTTAGKSGGTGLGTYSADIMTRTMGGSIDMTTSEEDGTKITVTLPDFTSND